MSERRVKAMGQRLQILLFFILGLRFTAGLIEKHRVTKLPGAEFTTKSQWFSGYLEAGKKPGTNITLYYHYVLVLSLNDDPYKDPLLLWTNGGPGSSSMVGLFTELGPYYLSFKSFHTKSYNESGIPSLFRKEYPWTRFANLLILNGPPPVGFSYCDPPGPRGDGFDCGRWNDEDTSIANFQFLEAFFDAYPEFSKEGNELYLTGESYAGVYVPTLVREILHNKGSASEKLLKGYAIGDGCVGTKVLCGGEGAAKIRTKLFIAEFMYGHGQIPVDLYQRIAQKCEQYFRYDPEDDSSFDSWTQRSLIATECEKNIEEMFRAVGNYFLYGLYDECWETTGSIDFGYTSFRKNQQKLESGQSYPCGGSPAMTEWLKNKEVKRILNVHDHAEFVHGSLDYVRTEPNLLPLHRHAANYTKLRVLIYNGDTDPELNTFVAQWWVNKLKLRLKEQWRPWTLDGAIRVAGYVTRYEGNFDFLTIRGSGHMAPRMKPHATFDMMKNWIRGEDWLPYNPSK